MADLIDPNTYAALKINTDGSENVSIVGGFTSAGSVSLAAGSTVGITGIPTVILGAGSAVSGYFIGEGIYNTAPSAVTSGASVPLLTDSIGRLSSTNTPQFGYATAATAAAAMPSSSGLANGLTLKAGPGNSGTVYVGANSSVTTATGFPLLAGDAVPLAASNASQIFILGNGTDLVNWAGN